MRTCSHSKNCDFGILSKVLNKLNYIIFHLSVFANIMETFSKYQQSIHTLKLQQMYSANFIYVLMLVKLMKKNYVKHYVSVKAAIWEMLTPFPVL